MFFTSEYLAQAENIQLFKKALLDNPYPQTVIDQERQFNALLSFDSRAWIHNAVDYSTVFEQFLCSDTPGFNELILTSV